jgi:hypothetical protein
MSAIPLAETIVALAASVEQAQRPGLVVTSAVMDVPLEASVVASLRGPVFLAAPAHTRWKSGFLPPVHVAHIEIAAEASG